MWSIRSTSGTDTTGDLTARRQTQAPEMKGDTRSTKLMGRSGRPRDVWSYGVCILEALIAPDARVFHLCASESNGAGIGPDRACSLPGSRRRRARGDASPALAALFSQPGQGTSRRAGRTSTRRPHSSRSSGSSCSTAWRSSRSGAPPSSTYGGRSKRHASEERRARFRVSMHSAHLFHAVCRSSFGRVSSRLVERRRTPRQQPRRRELGNHLSAGTM